MGHRRSEEREEEREAAPSPAAGRSIIERVRDAAARARQDLDAALQHDPAARNAFEVALTYPGLHALWAHRAAHALWRRGWRLPARVVSYANRAWTGIEVHPAARIGRGVFIDHGMGVVIGETATVGDGCLLYKGVVLGGTSLEKRVRHPQLGRNVVVGSNACVLGHISVGDGARIGSNSVVIKDVPPGATVVGVPGRVVAQGGTRHDGIEAELDHANLPDPVAEMIRRLATQAERLQKRVKRLEESPATAPAQGESDDDLALDPPHVRPRR